MVSGELIEILLICYSLCLWVVAKRNFSHWLIFFRLPVLIFAACWSHGVRSRVLRIGFGFFWLEYNSRILRIGLVPYRVIYFTKEFLDIPLSLVSLDGKATCMNNQSRKENIYPWSPLPHSFCNFYFNCRADGDKWQPPLKVYQSRKRMGSKAQNLIWHSLNDNELTWDLI